MSDYVIGLDLGGTKILSICVDRDMNIVSQDKRETEAEEGVDAVVRRMVESAKAAAGDRQIGAVGVSNAGPTNPFKGVVSTSPNLPGWHDVPLARLISDGLNLPAWIENDANAGALGEHRLGAGRGVQHMLMVAVGTGVGGGFVLNGRLHRGASGGAGEVGHMQIDIDGPPCGCGRHGCLEVLASGSAIDDEARRIAAEAPRGWVAELARREHEEPDARVLDMAAEAGDESAIAVLTRTGRYLGSGLASLTNLLNPELIVVGGSLRKSRLYLETAIEVAKKEAFPQLAADVRIVEAELGDEAPAMGAAVIAWEKLDGGEDA